MNSDNIQRRLAAILSADAKDYSLLMRADEAATVKTLTAYLDAMITLIQQHHGRVVDSPGDNLMAEFASVVDAVQGAVAIQKELKARNALLPEGRKMEFRIGINLGDVIVEGNRIYGDGVNIASRLENLAEPGGICISKTAYDQIEDKLPFGYEYLGEKTVKNIPKPVAAYRVLLEPEDVHRTKMPDEKSEQIEKLKQLGDIFGEARRSRRDRSRNRFNRRLRTYIIVIGFLFIINLMTYHGTWWFIWPALGWGILILRSWKRIRSTASFPKTGFEIEAILPKPQSEKSVKDSRNLKIRIEPTGQESDEEEAVDIKVPLQVLKAGVKLSSFLPEHAKEKVNAAFKTKGFNFDLASLKSEEIDLFIASLAGLNIVVEKDNAKVTISCE